MNKEEIKDYLKRVEELEMKLTGKDKDTYQWLIFGYNKCAELLFEKEEENKELKKINELFANSLYNNELIELKNENQQLKDRIDKAINLLQNNQFIWSAMDDEILEILKGNNDE